MAEVRRFEVGMQVSFSMLYGGTVSATVTRVLKTKVELTESWIAEDTGDTVTDKTSYKKRIDADGNESIVIWEYKGHECIIYPPAEDDGDNPSNTNSDVTANSKGTDNPTNTNKEESTMTNTTNRANRVTINTTEAGLEATFYRTHKVLTVVASNETEWKAQEGANATTNRESYRTWVCDHADMYGIEWNPAQQKQAWERKYNTYMTDEQVAEDALTLVTDAIHRLADKCRYEMTIDSLEVTGITAKDSSLSYVEEGKYTKSGAWCVADIEVTIGCHVAGQEMEMLYHMEMKSGQICKPKTTIAEWNEHMATEIEINGIEIPAKEDKKTA